MGELCLVGACATDVDAATFTAGYRGSIRQRDGRVTPIPTDHQGIGSSPLLKAPSRQSGFLGAGVESVPEYWPVRRRIRYPRSQA